MSKKLIEIPLELTEIERAIMEHACRTHRGLCNSPDAPLGRSLEEICRTFVAMVDFAHETSAWAQSLLAEAILKTVLWSGAGHDRTKERTQMIVAMEPDGVAITDRACAFYTVFNSTAIICGFSDTFGTQIIGVCSVYLNLASSSQLKKITAYTCAHASIVRMLPHLPFCSSKVLRESAPLKSAAMIAAKSGEGNE